MLDSLGHGQEQETMNNNRIEHHSYGWDMFTQTSQSIHLEGGISLSDTLNTYTTYLL